jgi:UDP-N-acetylmuramyl tripeptide synthase
MADCDWLTLEGRIVALLDRRVEGVHVDVNDLANPPFVHLWRPIA